MKWLAFLVLPFAACVWSPSVIRAADEKPQLWLYYPMNLLPAENIPKAREVWTRAAKAGYTRVLVGDSKFARLGEMPKEYFQHCEQLKALAKELNLQIVPSLFSIGYSNDLLSNDPNLAEGLPVKDQLFVVKGGQASLVADPAVKFGKVGFHDERVAIDGATATVNAGGGAARFTYALTVPAYRCYHVSVKIKTQDFHGGQPEIKALAGDASLQWKNSHVEPTQDWKQYDVVFNSLDHTSVNVYFGIWAETKGTLQWKDWKIEEVGLLNVLRRPGTPCVVKADGVEKTYAEGTDYNRIVDPHMGNDPWAGEYQPYHQPPTIHTKLPDGTRLRVSWSHPMIVYDEEVSICLSEPKTHQLLDDQAKRMQSLWDVPMFMMSHDEFRTGNQDAACLARHETPGQMLAENLKECTDLLRPHRAAVWNDMFDPYHNAVKGPYYLVNGPLTDSWNGLAKDVLVVNWNHGKRDQSLKFFADRGNEQLIAGYYDNDLSELDQWMASAKQVKGVVGYMYTTWRGDYSKVEEFGKRVQGK